MSRVLIVIDALPLLLFCRSALYRIEEGRIQPSGEIIPNWRLTWSA
jgi:hypothetical protein